MRMFVFTIVGIPKCIVKIVLDRPLFVKKFLFMKSYMAKSRINALSSNETAIIMVLNSFVNLCFVFTCFMSLIISYLLNGSFQRVTL